MMFIRSGEIVLKDELDMSFNYEPIYYYEIKTGIGEKATEYQENLLKLAKQGDDNLGEINSRLYGKIAGFSDKIVWDSDILQTITANGKNFRGNEKTKISQQDIINASTFPQDFCFMNERTRYVCGMSVPPIMIFRIVKKLIEGGYSMLQNELDMSFNYEPITYGEIKEGQGPANKDAQYYYILQNAIRADTNLRDTRVRIGLSDAQFNCMYCWEDEILPTLAAKHEYYDPIEKTKISGESIRNSQTFPQDYDFMSDLAGNWCYICGMSVPPLMIKRIVERLTESGVFDNV